MKEKKKKKKRGAVILVILAAYNNGAKVLYDPHIFVLRFLELSFQLTAPQT